jgi:hypothetical protein
MRWEIMKDADLLACFEPTSMNPTGEAQDAVQKDPANISGIPTEIRMGYLPK